MPSGWLWQVFAQPEVDESEMSFGWRRRWGRRQYAHFIRSGGRGGCRIPTQVERFVQHGTGRHVENFDSAAGQSLLLVMAPAFQDGAEFASARRGQTDFSQLEQIVHLFGNRVPGSSDVVVTDDWRDASRLWPAGWLELGFGSLARRQRERRIRFADPPARLDVMALLVFGHSDAALLFIALRREQCLIFCQNQKETTKKESTNWVTATQTIHCWQKSAFRKSRRKGGFISVAVTTCWTNCCLTLRVRVCWTPARGSVPARQPFAKFTSARLVNYIANYFSFSFLFSLFCWACFSGTSYVSFCARHWGRVWVADEVDDVASRKKVLFLGPAGMCVRARLDVECPPAPLPIAPFGACAQLLVTLRMTRSFLPLLLLNYPAVPFSYRYRNNFFFQMKMYAKRCIESPSVRRRWEIIQSKRHAISLLSFFCFVFINIKMFQVATTLVAVKGGDVEEEEGEEAIYSGPRNRNRRAAWEMLLASAHHSSMTRHHQTERINRLIESQLLPWRWKLLRINLPVGAGLTL